MEKNLDSEKALQKFKELVNDIQICMFITDNSGDQEHTRPMATIEVEENGTLWFFTDIRSIKVEEVSMTSRVHLVYAHPGKESYVDVWGNAKVVTDKKMLEEKWSPVVKAYFPKGVDDPNLGLLQVVPDDAYYWDAETGKMMQFLKMAVSAVAGKRLAEGSSGNLNI